MRTVVVGDDVILRQALAGLLAAEDTFDVVGQAGTTAIDLIAGIQPDLVILDDGTRGRAWAVVPAVRQAIPRARVVVLTARADPHRLGPVLLVGADAVLGPGAGKDDLSAVVHGWTAGGGDDVMPAGRADRPRWLHSSDRGTG